MLIKLYRRRLGNIRIFVSLYLFILLLTGWNNLLSGQEYIFQVADYGMEDGLSHTDVQSIHQDRDGFIWIGTNYGLNRFDGYRFKWFTQEKHGLQSNAVNHILEDDKGWLWLINTGFQTSREVRTIDIFNPITEQLFSFEKKFGKKLPFAPSDINSFCASDEGRLAFVTKQKKLWVYSSADGFKEHDLGIYPLSLEMFSRHNTIWCHASKTADNLRDVIVEIDLKGSVVNRYEHKFPFQHNFIAGIDKVDNLWYLSRHWETKRFEKNQKGGIFKIDPSGVEHSFLLGDSALPGGAVNLDMSMIGFEYGFWLNPEKDNFWLYSKGSFLGFHPASGWSQELAATQKELAHPNVVFFDNAGKTWVGTTFGLYVINLNSNPFRSLAYDATKESLLAFRGITQDKQNTLWACIDRGAGWLGRFKTTGGAYETEIIGPEKAAWGRGYKYGIFSDRKGNIWFGSGQENIITRYNPVNNSLQQFLYQIPDNRQVNIWSFYEDKNSRIWFGTDNGIIGYIGADNSVALLPKVENISAKGGCIYQFFEDATGRVRLCTDDGLYQLDPERKSAMPYHPEGLDFLKSGIYHAHTDADGSFWLGSNGLGLFKWNPESKDYLRFTKADGLSDNTIYAVYEDDSGNLWLPTNYGINQFNKTSFRSKAFLEKDGVSGHEFNRISHYQGKDGRLYFGGINGLTSFHPKDIAKEHSAVSLPLVITEFQQFDGEQNKLVERTADLRDTRKITMLPNDRYFRIAFALLEYINLENVQYGYRIEGIDKAWTFQKENSLQLSRLPYGKHILRIKGQGADGQWSTNELSIAVEVLKPFYLQSWFLLLCGAFLLISGPAFYIMRTNQLKKQKQQLEMEIVRRTETIKEQAEELKSLEQLKSRFFANVSHELRTPLSLMIGPLDSILKKESDRPEKEQRLLEFVRNNSKHLLKLVNEILDLSKLESGRMELKEEALNFHSFLEPIVAQFSSYGDSESVKILFDYQSDPGLNIKLDENKFEKIVHNFLSNAIKFSPPGSVVKFKVEATDGDLLVSVTDQGPGIHPNDLPHIFDRFYQSKLLEAPAQGGTGIGLSIAAELAHLLGGKIWSESEFGKGSTFFFRFPVKKVDSPLFEVRKPQPDKSLTELPTSDFQAGELKPTLLAKKASILIVEDNPELRSYMQLLLEDDYHVITAENGKVGWDYLLQTADCQLIISDLMMPIMDGFQLLEKIKSHETLRHLPVIMLTARADVRVKLRALRIGVDDYLTKPFVQEELQVRIKNLLYNYRERVMAMAEIGREEEIHLPEKPVMHASEDDWLENVEAIFSKILSDSQFKIDWVAGQMHLSERQFDRRLKQHTGLTPNNYLREMRLQRAKDFLHEGKYSTVKEVGFAVGFYDTKYFSGLFRERFGILPSTYLS